MVFGGRCVARAAAAGDQGAEGRGARHAAREALQEAVEEPADPAARAARDRDPELLEDPHDREASRERVDDEVGHVENQLAKRGLTDSTIIVFASDHGESLGDDPRLLDTHGTVAYHMLVRVPFAIHIPGVAPGQRTDLVSLVDLAPTLLDLLGMPTAMQPLDGVDLLPAILDAPAGLRTSRDLPMCFLPPDAKP